MHTFGCETMLVLRMTLALLQRLLLLKTWYCWTWFWCCCRRHAEDDTQRFPCNKSHTTHSSCSCTRLVLHMRMPWHTAEQQNTSVVVPHSSNEAYVYLRVLDLYARLFACSDSIARHTGSCNVDSHV